MLDWDRAIVLPEDQNRKLPQYEKILRDNILRAPKMLLGSSLGVPEDPQVIPPLQEVPLLRNVRGSIGEIPSSPPSNCSRRKPTGSPRPSASQSAAAAPALQFRAAAPALPRAGHGPPFRSRPCSCGRSSPRTM
ncbi:MAG: hypothetical protein WDN28_09585 [Chthoniobacter sp.]